MALELGTDVVDVDGGLLGVENPGADLDGLRERDARRLPGLGPFTNDARGALVGELEPLDHEPVADRADGTLIDAVEW